MRARIMSPKFDLIQTFYRHYNLTPLNPMDEDCYQLRLVWEEAVVSAALKVPDP